MLVRKELRVSLHLFILLPKVISLPEGWCQELAFGAMMRKLQKHIQGNWGGKNNIKYKKISVWYPCFANTPEPSWKNYLKKAKSAQRW